MFILTHKQISQKKQTKKGMAIIEILFAMGVISICLVALTIAILGAVRNARYAKNTSRASQYAQEAIEIARKERDRNTWEDFKTNFSAGSYELDSSLAWYSGCSGDHLIGVFKRCVEFAAAGDDKRKVTVTITWEESSRTRTVRTVTFLSNWSQ